MLPPRFPIFTNLWVIKSHWNAKQMLKCIEKEEHSIVKMWVTTTKTKKTKREDKNDSYSDQTVARTSICIKFLQFPIKSTRFRFPKAWDNVLRLPADVYWFRTVLCAFRKKNNNNSNASSTLNQYFVLSTHISACFSVRLNFKRKWYRIKWY